MARKKKAHAGGHGWFVTFADLMGLLMSFFVVVAAFSSQDKVKLAKVAGSMREAFGVARDSRLAGVVEISGVQTKDFLKDVSPTADDKLEIAVANERRDQQRRQGPELTTRDNEQTTQAKSRQFATAAATLRQALQNLPEISSLSQNIIFEETPDGLAVQLVDQDGRSMFPDGSRFPYERTRQALQSLAPALTRLPNPITIIGHTSSRRVQGRAGYSNWDLSSERANAVRQVLSESGLPSDRIAAVTGKADNEPYVLNNPFATTNSRVTILVMPAASALPRNLRP